jgi:hypothetical protein
MTKAQAQRRLCGAKRKSGGKCTQNAGWGTDHPGVGSCKLHGGNTTTHRASAVIEIEEREARTLLQRLGEPVPIHNPVAALLAVAAETRAWQEILRERVDALHDLVYDSYGRDDDSDSSIIVEREKAIVALYERSLDRTSRILASLVKLDLDARRVVLEESQTDLMFRALQAVLSGLPKQYQEPAKERLVLALREADKV